MDDLSELEKRALAELAECRTDADLRAWAAKYVGEKGALTAALKALGTLPKDQRPAYGQAVNRLKQTLLAAEEQKKTAVKEVELLASLTPNPLDVTLPGRPGPAAGCTSPRRSCARSTRIFADLGFQVYRSREVEDDETNFELLNMPPHHPARDMWDTFHTTTPGVLLRTHTSPGQIHVMRELCPEPDPRHPAGHVLPLRGDHARAARSVPPGRGPGRSATDVTMADLKGTITAFARRLFGAGAAGAHPVELLPVHRAVDRGGHRLAEGRPERATG